MTRRARKPEFRGGSISEFFNSIDVERTLQIATMYVELGGSVDCGTATHIRRVDVRADGASIFATAPSRSPSSSRRSQLLGRRPSGRRHVATLCHRTVLFQGVG